MRQQVYGQLDKKQVMDSIALKLLKSVQTRKISKLNPVETDFSEGINLAPAVEPRQDDEISQDEAEADNVIDEEASPLTFNPSEPTSEAPEQDNQDEFVPETPAFEII